MSQISFLTELNEVQHKAVTTFEGPVMVIAGPGSGKTRVLTYRIAYMIEQGVAPYNILTLTFTNKAAREMKERLEKVVGAQGNRVWAGTFHSVFAKILRIEADKIGFPPSFTIYDTDDSKSLISHIVQEMNLDGKLYASNMIRNRISSAKSLLISPAAYQQDVELTSQDKINNVPHIGKIYEKYAQRCKAAGAMDFDDLLYNIFVLFHRNPDNVLEKYQQKFKYLLVDEFQDTNFLQYAILKKLVKYPGSGENICIVGDDAQSIYAFRGATIDNILIFGKDFANLQTFKLEQNYRSGKYIVNAANNVITNNSKQIKKEIWTSQPDSAKIGMVRALTDAEESRKVVDVIFEHKNRNHIPNAEIAILYRTNAQSRGFEEQLRRANIPYKIYGGMSFYQRKEIKDLIAYFRLVVNPKDEEAFRRIVNYPKRGVGDTSIDRLFTYAAESGKTFWEAVDDNILPAKAQSTIAEFKKMIVALNHYAEQHPADKAANMIFTKSGLATVLKADTTIEGMGRLENVNSLLDGVKEFVENDEEIFDEDGEVILERGTSMVDYLQSISLITDFDQKEDSNDHINLMSVHSAKGLEFDSVFVVGLEEQLFPSFLSLKSESEIDEERRLFYVAITRARKMLTLTYATSRYQYGKVVYNSPSRFLDEVGEENLSAPLHRAKNLMNESAPRASVLGSFVKKAAPPPAAASFDVVASPVSAFVIGAKVLHPRFGKGIIKNIDGATDNKVATVAFSSFDDSDRRIMLKFAKMQVME